MGLPQYIEDEEETERKKFLSLCLPFSLRKKLFFSFLNASIETVDGKSSRPLEQEE